MLPPAVELLLEHAPVAAETDGDRVASVTLRGGGEDTVVAADWFLDASETGALLPLTGAEHVTGFESQAMTGEPHAPAEYQPGNLQPVTVCFAVDHLAGEDHTIPRPARYDEFAARFGWVAPDPRTNRAVAPASSPTPARTRSRSGHFDDPELDKDLWRFRRIAARGLSRPAPMLRHHARELAAGRLPGRGRARRAGGGGARAQPVRSCTGCRPRRASPACACAATSSATRRTASPSTPTSARRGACRAVTTVRRAGPDRRAPARFPDSVGIGAYRIDLHPSTGGDPYIDLASHPFEIPLGALVRGRIENLIGAGKAIGTTHITNGAYRLHPVEWNVGEAAGHLVAHCAARGTTPRAVPKAPAELQRELEAASVELRWRSP